MDSGKKNLVIFGLMVITLVFFGAQSRAGDSFRTVFKVRKLSCGACLDKIETRLKAFDGYIGMLANLDMGLIVVDHREGLTGNQIAEAITALGYPAKVASESESDQYRSVTSESTGWTSPDDGFFAWIMGLFGR